jgi:hypothetical protein
MEEFRLAERSPIVFIGGLGGSGTRAVAGAVAKLGFYPGGRLNPANDNPIFTELFKWPDWLRSGPPESEIRDRLQLFERVMRDGVDSKCVEAWPDLERFSRSQGRGLADHPEAIGWMTKEPNSHIFLPQIMDLWPSALFIYVTRHPLDMAFSSKRGQMRRWGWFLGMEKRSFDNPIAAQLEFWIRAQRRLESFSERFPGRIYQLRFEAFAAQPQRELANLIQSLGLPVGPERIPVACTEVIQPDSVGRYRTHGLSYFQPSQLDFCRAAGWPIEATPVPT